MTTRLLDPSEHALLAGTDLGRALPYLPSGTRVVIAEDAGRVLGHIGLVPLLHVEGIAIDPQVTGLRRGRVFQALVQAMHAEARARGEHTVFPAAADPAMVEIVAKLGAVEVPARWFALPVKES